MWDDNSIHPKIESGFDFTVDMKYELSEKFDSDNFNQGSAILRVKY